MCGSQLLLHLQKKDVIGFDISIEKVNLYKQGINPTKEVGDIGI